MPTWETNDGIAADGSIGHVASDVVHDCGVAFSCVAALHEPEDVVITALEWDVEEFAELGERGASLDKAVCMENTHDARSAQTSS